MHISKSSKVIFLVLNHLVAAHNVPLGFLQRLQYPQKGGSHGTNGAPSGPAGNEKDGLFEFEQTLIARAPPRSCPRCIEKCPPLQIRDDRDCNLCFQCPPGMKGDSKSQKCIPRDKRKPTQEDKKKAFEKTRQNKIELRQALLEFLRPTESQKKAALKDKKERMQTTYAYRKKQDAFKKKTQLKTTTYKRYHEERSRTRARRAGRCLQVVALAMGAEAADTYADDYFDEGYLNETMALTDLVPEYIEVPIITKEEEDAHWESDEYVEQWVKYSKGMDKRGTSKLYTGPGRAWDLREGPLPTDLDYGIRTLDSREVMQLNGHHKRFFWIFILPAIVGVVSRVTAVALRVGIQGMRYTFKFARTGKAKVSRAKMTQEAKKIAADKNWVNCLKGNGPK